MNVRSRVLLGVSLLLACVALLASCSRVVKPVSRSEQPGTDGRLSMSEPTASVPGPAPGIIDPRAESVAWQGPSFYPLELGNRWHYARSFRMQVLPDSAPPEPPIEILSTGENELICTEVLSGRSYVVEEQRVREGDRVFDNVWIRYRQDWSGLFEADLTSGPPVCAPPAPGMRRAGSGADAIERGAAETALARIADPARRLAYQAAWDRLWVRISGLRRVLGAPLTTDPGLARRPGGVLPGEITRLRYPLRPGAHWVIRDDPLFDAVVEGPEVLALTPGRLSGWRIRIGSDLFGDDDQVHVWYGRDGFLRLHGHFESEATDPSGNPVGRVISDQSELLDGIDLVVRGRLAVRGGVAVTR